MNLICRLVNYRQLTLIATQPFAVNGDGKTARNDVPIMDSVHSGGNAVGRHHPPLERDVAQNKEGPGRSHPRRAVLVVGQRNDEVR